MATRELVPVRGLERTTNADRAALIRMADRLGMNPNYIASVFSFETAGSFDPGQPNLGGGRAIGLIQFMPHTAANLKTSREELAAMTFQEQLAFVEKYFRQGDAHKRIKTLSDHYMAVFAPIGIGKSPDFALYKAPSQAYKQNAKLDREGNNVISVANATIPVAGIYAAAKAKPPVIVDMTDGGEPTTPPRGVPTGEVFTPIVRHRYPWLRVLVVAAGALGAYAAASRLAKRAPKKAKA